jgi:hypothetical protein
MKKTVKAISMTAALAVMIPLSAYAATGGSGTTASAGTAGHTAAASTISGKQWKEGEFGKRGAVVGQDVLDLLKLDAAAYKAKLAEGKTLAQIADAQGVTRDALKKALTDSFNKQMDQRKKTFADNLDKMIDAKPGARPDKHFGFQNLAAATQILNMTDAELKAATASGKSIADIAKEKNVDVQKVIDAEKAAITDAINQAVKDGKITQAEADKRLADAAAQADRIVNEKEGQEGHGFGGGKHRGGSQSSTGATNATN